jgi:hypothetical protein
VVQYLDTGAVRSVQTGTAGASRTSFNKVKTDQTQHLPWNCHAKTAPHQNTLFKSTAPTISSSRLYITTPSVVAAAQQRPVGDNVTQLVRASARFLLGAPGTFMSAAASSMGCRQETSAGHGLAGLAGMVGYMW